MLDEGEEIIHSFLENHGLKPVKIKEKDTKTPDFQVYQNEELLFYCEEKTFENIEFEGIMDDNSRNTITSAIKRASEQFEAVNEDHTVPNILAINNKDGFKDFNDLVSTLTGSLPIIDNRKMKIHNVGRIEKKSGIIDLYLWFERGKDMKHLWTESNNKHYKELLSIFPDLKQNESS